MPVYYVMVLAREATGLLRRVSGLCENRGYALQSLSVGGIGGGMVRLGLAVDEPRERAERLARQLERLTDVMAVEVAGDHQAVRRELALIKVRPSPGRRSEVLQVAQVFRARVVDASPGTVVLEVTGTADKIDALLAVLQEYDVAEVARGGVVTLRRGPAALGAEPSEPGQPAEQPRRGSAVV